MKRKALGRGLSVLLADMPEKKTENREIKSIPIGQISSNQFQPRAAFDDESLLELAESIQNHGILQPLLVRTHPENSDQFQLIAGERRLRAAKLAEKETVPCVLLDAEEAQMLEIALIENIQRSDLNPVEEAKAFKQLSERFSLTQEEISSRVGRSRESIANFIRFLSLPEVVLNALESGGLSAGHAKALLALKNNEHIEQLAENVIQHGLSVRETERMVRENLTANIPEQQQEKKPKEKDHHLQDLEHALEESFQTKVNVKLKGKKKGILEIHFYDLDHLDGLLQRWNVKIS